MAHTPPLRMRLINGSIYRVDSEGNPVGERISFTPGTVYIHRMNEPEEWNPGADLFPPTQRELERMPVLQFNQLRAAQRLGFDRESTSFLESYYEFEVDGIQYDRRNRNGPAFARPIFEILNDNPSYSSEETLDNPDLLRESLTQSDYSPSTIGGCPGGMMRWSPEVETIAENNAAIIESATLTKLYLSPHLSDDEINHEVVRADLVSDILPFDWAGSDTTIPPLQDALLCGCDGIRRCERCVGS